MIRKYFSNIAEGVRQIFKRDGVGKFLQNVDKLLNAILGGDPQETISSRLGKVTHRGVLSGGLILCKILNVLDFSGKDHCKNAIDPDEGSDQVAKK